MMLMFVLFLTFNVFKLTENSFCSGVGGKVCCDGFALNHSTGLCQKCPVGYYRLNCSEKCIYPTYGMECQSQCKCSQEKCNFVTGCLKGGEEATNNHIRSTKGVTVKPSTQSSTVRLLNISVKYQTVEYAFSRDINKYSETTLSIVPTGIDLLTDNLVVRIIISLIGVFVFCFAIFVFTYMYFKCFRKTNNASGGVKENEWQAQYKSLSFDAMEPQLIPLHPDQQGRMNADFTYLTPVFSGNESRESRRIGETDRRKENEIIPETHLQEQRVSSQETISRQNEPSIGHDDVQEHVYIEITEEKTESSILNADRENEHQKATCTNAIKEEL